MRKFILGFAALAVIAAPIATAGAASANSTPVPELGGNIALTVSNVTYAASGDCVDAPVSVKIDMPDDYAYAEFEYTSTYDGPTSWTDEIYGNEAYSGTYSHTFKICPEFDSPGSYMGSLDVTFYDYDYNVVASSTATDPFTVSAYHAPAVHHTSSLGTTKVKAGAHGWALRSTSRYDGHAWRNHQVLLQRYASGAWHNAQAKWTDSNGRANFGVTPAAGAAKGYRVVLTKGTGTAAHATGTYWLKRR